MSFSFSTVYMTVLISNLLLLLMFLCFRNTKLLINAGYQLLAFFVMFISLRFLLPIEFPFATNVLLPKWLSRIVSQICHPLFNWGNTPISIWTFLLLIWGVGIIVHLAKYIRLTKRIRHQIFTNALDITSREPYASVLEQICNDYNRKNSFRILQVTGISTPMLYGIRHPFILIPESLSLSGDDLYYTLLHETSHHFHHDLLIKQLIKLITILYWWNPLCYLLNHQVNTVLEMRIDQKAASSNKATILAYLNCLLHLAEQSSVQQHQMELSTMHLLPEHRDVLTMRFQMLTHQKKRLALTLTFLLLFIATFISSYLVIFEAYYASPEVLETTIGQTIDNTYAVQKADGTYDIYFQNVFIENTASLEYYISDIPIYAEDEFID